MNYYLDSSVALGWLLISKKVKSRAKESFPTIVGTLDAIHISSAMLWQTEFNDSIIALTKDKQMKTCFEALGFEVLD